MIPGTIVWLNDVEQAKQVSKWQGLPILAYFRPEGGHRDFEFITCADTTTQRMALGYVCLWIEGSERLGVQHMEGKPGLAIIKDKPIAELPFFKSKYYGPETHEVSSVVAFLECPTQSVTQNALVHSVKLHPENPKSVYGRPDDDLFEFCRQHSEHQARINRQGHHNWDRRMRQIREKVGGADWPVEVCAESWSGQPLVEACFSCVYAWHYSSGHWRAVSSEQPAFGYDIKLGSSKIWYATGIFGGSP